MDDGSDMDGEDCRAGDGGGDDAVDDGGVNDGVDNEGVSDGAEDDIMKISGWKWQW